VPVAHACNPSYLRGSDQADCSWQPARANSSEDPISKIPITKKGWWSEVAQGVVPEFKPQYRKKKKKKKKRNELRKLGISKFTASTTKS
jgi:hypothetical protein